MADLLDAQHLDSGNDSRSMVLYDMDRSGLKDRTARTVSYLSSKGTFLAQITGEFASPRTAF